MKFTDLYLLRMNYAVDNSSEFRDKIVFFNSKNVCIRNSQKLVYGSLILHPKDLRVFSNKDNVLNVHKSILLKEYKY